MHGLVHPGAIVSPPTGARLKGREDRRRRPLGGAPARVWTWWGSQASLQVESPEPRQKRGLRPQNIQACVHEAPGWHELWAF